MPAVLSSALARARLLLGGLTDVLLPQTCVVCGDQLPGNRAPACRKCRAALEAIRAIPYCPRCGRSVQPVTVYDKRCGWCRREHFWNVAAVARVGAYQLPIRRLTIGLKYGGRERNALYLAKQLAAALRDHAWFRDLDALVPVPMHLLRRCQRKCNHALVLATALSKVLRIPVVKGIRRTKNTPSQTRIDTRAKRFENVKGCFAPHRPKRIAGRTVCIVDNLMATGATIHEVSKVLRKAGAKRIYVAIAARTATPSDVQAEPLTVPDNPPD